MTAPNQDGFPIRFPRDVGILASPRRVITETPSWVEHIPFAFWIVGAAAPRVIVELGTHYGNSYFAFAQSVQEQGLSTSMFAVDTWKGDEHAAFYGEETTIGLAEFILDGLPAGTPTYGAIETHVADIAAVDGLSLDAVARTDLHGEALVAHLGRTELPATKGVVWLSGEAGSVLVLRAALLERGLERGQLRIKPYWSLQGKAHRKRLERTALRA